MLVTTSMNGTIMLLMFVTKLPRMFPVQVITLALILSMLNPGVCWEPIDDDVSVTEGQTLFLKCIFDKWFVTYNDQEILVSDCSSGACQNFMPEKFSASFNQFGRHRGRHHGRMSTILQVFYMERNLTGVTCGGVKVTFNFKVQLPKVTLMTDKGTETINTNPESHVTFKCSTDQDNIGSLSLYKSQPGNILNVTLKSNEVTYVMSNFKCGTSFLVGCQADNNSETDSKIKVNVIECKTTGIYLSANSQSNKVSVDASEQVSIMCKSEAPPGSVMNLYSSESLDSLAQAITPSVLTYTGQITSCSANQLYYSCQDDFSRTEILVNVIPEEANKLIFTSNIDSNDYIEDSDTRDDLYVTEDNTVNLNCMAGSCYTGNVLSLRMDGQTLREAVVPDTIYYGLQDLPCGSTVTVECGMSGTTETFKEILIHTSSCEEHHKLHSRKRLVIGASVGSAAVVIFIVAIVTVCCCRKRCINKGAGTHDVKKVPPVYVVDSKDLVYTDVSVKEHKDESSAPPEYSTLPPSYNEAIVYYK